MFPPQSTMHSGFQWKRKTLAIAIGVALTATVSLPASAASQTISSPTPGTVSLTGTDTLQITNSGSVTVGSSSTAGTAVDVTNGAGVTLTNDGLISASGQSSGSGIYDDGDLLGSISNAGSIAASVQNSSTATASGIHINGSIASGGVLSNEGSITAMVSGRSGATAYAVYTDSVAASGGILSNSGSISSSATTEATSSTQKAVAKGIYVGPTGSSTFYYLGMPSSVLGELSNSGTISADAQGGEATAEGIYLNGNLEAGGVVTNSGRITAKATAPSRKSYASGIYFYWNIYGDMTNTRTGVIKAQASSVSGTASAQGIFAYTSIGDQSSPQNGTLTNAGTVMASATVQSGTAYAAGINSKYDVSGLVSNSGSIVASATATKGGTAGVEGVCIGGNLGTTSSSSGQPTASALMVSAQAGSSATPYGMLANSGTISAQASAQGGGSDYATGVYVGSYLSGSLINSGTITASASAKSAIANAYGVYVHHLDGTVSNSGTIVGTADDPTRGYSLFGYDGSGTVDNQSGGLLAGNLNVGGSVSLTNAGTVSIPDGAAATVGGDYTQTGTGTFRFGATSASQYGTLTVGGNAGVGGRLFVNVAKNNTLAAGQTLTGVVSAGTVSGTYSSIGDNTLAYNFLADYLNNSIDLNVVGTGMTSIVDAVRKAGDPSAVGAAGVLDKLLAGGTTSPEVQNVLDRITSSSNAQQVAGKVDQVLPLFNGDSALIESRLLGNLQQVVGDEIRGRSSGGVALGNRKMWLKPFGAWSEQGDKDGVAGYTSSFGGMLVGADADVDDATRVGVAMAYGHGHVGNKSYQAPQSSKLDMVDLIGYGRTALSPVLSVDYQLDIGRNHTNGRRFMPTAGLTANSSYDSTTAHAGAGLNRTWRLGSATRLVPSVRLDYTAVHDEGYSETGAGGLNLNVDAHTYQRLDLGVGGKLIHQLDDKSYLTASLGGALDALHKRGEVTATLASAPGLSFSTAGLRPSRWSWHGGIGVTARIKPNLDLTGGYAIQGESGYTNQVLSAKLRWSF